MLNIQGHMKLDDLKISTQQHYGRTVSERFWSHVDKTGNCWNWTAFKDVKKGGYGLFWINRTDAISAHRMSYLLEYGEIPDGRLVCHRCDNPACVRPDHLFIGTWKSNQEDCRNKGRYPDRFGNDSPRHKLTEIDVRIIRERYAKGEIRQQDLADEYGVNRATIGFALSGRNWKNV